MITTRLADTISYVAVPALAVLPMAVTAAHSATAVAGLFRSPILQITAGTASIFGMCAVLLGALQSGTNFVRDLLDPLTEEPVE